jgi:hypothetical protein
MWLQEPGAKSTRAPPRDDKRLQLRVPEPCLDFDVFDHARAQGAAHVGHDFGLDSAATLDHHEHGRLARADTAATFTDFRARWALCMLRAFPPMNVSSTSTSPDRRGKLGVCIASLMRCSMNHADCCVILQKIGSPRVRHLRCPEPV